MCGEEEYIRYLGGVAILTAPRSRFSRSIYEGQLNHVKLEELLTDAEDLMVSGLKGVIAFANMPEDRTALYARAQWKYQQARPNMRKIVESTYRDQSYRVGRISEVVFDFQPAPIVGNETIYKLLCHGHYSKLKTASLLDRVPPSRYFKNLIANRNLSDRNNSNE